MTNQMQTKILILAALSASLAVPAIAQYHTFTEFDAPGAGTESSPVCISAFLGFLGCGTTPLAINDSGVVVGVYSDSKIAMHGFLRTTDGQFTSFDAPGAGLAPGQGTAAYAINERGMIAGAFQDSSNVYHGFVRFQDGSFETIDVPEEGTIPQQGTLVTNINSEGVIAGSYIDANGVNHGFVRSRREFASFDPPESVFTYPCEETCLGPDGSVVGFFVDGANTTHGFLRTPDGKITVIDAPGAGRDTPNQLGTVAASINALGTIAGYYVDSQNIAHGFLRRPDGFIETWDVPPPPATIFQPPAGPNLGTAAFSVNTDGAIAGDYWDAGNTAHGFVRAPDGTFTICNAPNAASGSSQGTRPSTNNLGGSLTGWYIDARNVNHGFVWQP